MHLSRSIVVEPRGQQIQIPMPSHDRDPASDAHGDEGAPAEHGRTATLRSLLRTHQILNMQSPVERTPTSLKVKSSSCSHEGGRSQPPTTKADNGKGPLRSSAMPPRM